MTNAASSKIGREIDYYDDPGSGSAYEEPKDGTAVVEPRRCFAGIGNEDV